MNHLGSVRIVTDQNANVVSRHDYLPFGEEIPGGVAGRSSPWGAGTDNVNYDIGNGQYLSPSQFNQAIQSAVDAQEVAFASAVAGKTGVSYDAVYAALNPLKNADGTTVVNGGNVQLDVGNQALIDAIQNLLAAGANNRSAGAPSIHLHGSDPTGPYHLDTMSPYPLFGPGLLVHFGVDVFAGTLFYGPIPIPRP